MEMFNKKESEELIEFIMRMSELKKLDKEITWQLIADLVEREYGITRSESWVRRAVKSELRSMASLCDDCVEPTVVENNNKTDSLFETLLKLKKERVKLSDERIQANAYYRALSREETIKEIALLTAQEMTSKKLLPTYSSSVVTDIMKCNEAILCISDWHYGIEVSNPWNKFNPDICKERVAKLLSETIRRVKENKVRKLHLVNLGDLIAGRIHLGLRLDSRFDVITQVMEVSEILAEFISSLTKHVYVDYYDCLDNHSRLEPNKKESQELETFARITPWYLKERLSDNERFSIKENEFGHDLCTFNCLGYEVIGVHGDKDKPLTVIDHLSMMTEKHYDMVLTAHMHHFSGEEKNRCVAIGNGTLMGTDSFAQKLRLSSTPSQNLIIVSNDNVTDCIYRIVL